LNILTIHLERSGFDVLIARNGTDALEMIQELRPAVIVLDERMPGLKGTEICQSLALNPATASIPAILLTGYSGASAVGGNIRRIIAKPFSPRDVVRAILELSVRRRAA
jgi:CheY-like chemotaxis protein